MGMKMSCPLTLTLFNQGAREEKIKDEILTPSKSEGSG